MSTHKIQRHDIELDDETVAKIAPLYGIQAEMVLADEATFGPEVAGEIVTIRRNWQQLLSSFESDELAYLPQGLNEDPRIIVQTVIDILLADEDTPLDVDALPCVNYAPLPWRSVDEFAVHPVHDARKRFYSRVNSLTDLRKLFFKGWIEYEFDWDYAFALLRRKLYPDQDISQQLNPHDTLMFNIQCPERIRDIVGTGSELNFRYGHHFGSLESNMELLNLMKPPEEHADFDAYFAQEQTVSLSNQEGAFPPSYTSMLFAHNVHIDQGDTVYGVGAGSGFLEILSSKLGASEVIASEVEASAVELARVNAEQNSVLNCRLEHCAMFEATDGKKFNVIIANLPQTPEDPNNPGANTGIDAGKDGTRFLEEFLAEVSDHLDPNGRVYICAASVANVSKVAELASKNFYIRKIASQEIPVREDAMDRFDQIRDNGTTNYTYRNTTADYVPTTNDMLLELTRM